ncbi:MAG: hypothetical protein ACLP6E_06810 [Acidimicrobiales bacterium]
MHVCCAIALRLEPHDEYMHELGPEPNFNESMYFNVFDTERRAGGFFRLGNRPNEGRGEMTTCIYLPDGRVAFMFRRPQVTTNDEFHAAGMRFEVIEPFATLRVTFEGSAVLLDEPLEMANPSAAFSSNPHASCRVDLTYRGIAPMYGGEPERPTEALGEEFARGHYEQLVAAAGEITVDGERTVIEGFGLRDHSWGPRYWQAPLYYRWLTANFGPEFGFMGSRIARRNGGGIRTGFVWDGTELHQCDDLRVRTQWTEAHRYHRFVEVELTAGKRLWKARGTVLSLIPLRNRRHDAEANTLVTRICEGLTCWTLEDGRVGYGMSEYLDQVEDGGPVGVDE